MFNLSSHVAPTADSEKAAQSPVKVFHISPAAGVPDMSLFPATLDDFCLGDPSVSIRIFRSRSC
jgi:hypothetical protein